MVCVVTRNVGSTPLMLDGALTRSRLTLHRSACCGPRLHTRPGRPALPQDQSASPGPEQVQAFDIDARSPSSFCSNCHVVTLLLNDGFAAARRSIRCRPQHPRTLRLSSASAEGPTAPTPARRPERHRQQQRACGQQHDSVFLLFMLLSLLQIPCWAPSTVGQACP
jgi:hypothetical protein